MHLPKLLLLHNIPTSDKFCCVKWGWDHTTIYPVRELMVRGCPDCQISCEGTSGDWVNGWNEMKTWMILGVLSNILWGNLGFSNILWGNIGERTLIPFVQKDSRYKGKGYEMVYLLTTLVEFNKHQLNWIYINKWIEKNCMSVDGTWRVKWLSNILWGNLGLKPIYRKIKLWVKGKKMLAISCEGTLRTKAVKILWGN